MGLQIGESQMKISIIIPAFNEEQGLTKVLDRLIKLFPTEEIIVVDDGSVDSTYEIASKFENIKVIRHERNYGYGAALKSGIKHASSENLIFLDADGQHNAEDIGKFENLLRNYDLVVGERTNDKKISGIRMPGKFILKLVVNFSYDVMYMAKQIKSHFPKIRIAVGGYHVNSMPSDFYSDDIDYIFVGEAEYSLLELMNRLDANDKSKHGIPGLIYSNHENKEWIMNLHQNNKINFDDMPNLPYEMILNNNYTAWWTVINPNHHKYMATITGKGCPLQCSFCDVSKTEGLKYRSTGCVKTLFLRQL